MLAELRTRLRRSAGGVAVVVAVCLDIDWGVGVRVGNTVIDVAHVVRIIGWVIDGVIGIVESETEVTAKMTVMIDTVMIIMMTVVVESMHEAVTDSVPQSVTQFVPQTQPDRVTGSVITP